MRIYLGHVNRGLSITLTLQKMACSIWPYLISLGIHLGKSLSPFFVEAGIILSSTRDWSAGYNHSHLICKTQPKECVHKGTNSHCNKCHSTLLHVQTKSRLLKPTIYAEYPSLCCATERNYTTFIKSFKQY